MSETTKLTQTDRLDDQLALLANGERRAIITHLRETGPDTTSLDTLATILASDSPTDRDYARIRLHHTHLPKLAQTPFLSYDPDTTIVQYHGHPDLETLLDTLPTHETAQS